MRNLYFSLFRGKRVFTAIKRWTIIRIVDFVFTELSVILAYCVLEYMERNMMMNKECRQTIDAWIDKADGQEIVLVIGAGFSRNAIMSSLHSSAGCEIPIWDDVIKAVQTSLCQGKALDPPDKLFLFDIYRNYFGSNQYEDLLAQTMPDNELEPGEVHKFLSGIPKIRAIITTNNIDTLLDKTFPNARKIINDTDITRRSQGEKEIIYLHGHRLFPKTWVYSRSDYERLIENYPLKTGYCKRLLSSYPTLFIGFGYYDEDIHSIMRFVIDATAEYAPAMLSLAVEDTNNALSSYWEKLGLSIANVHEDGGKISEELIDGLKYLNNQRIKELQNKGILSFGYRAGNSYMDMLIEKKLECKKDNKGKILLCDYHLDRSKAAIIRIPSRSANIISLSDKTAFIPENSAVVQVLKRLEAGEIIAGSWGLMPSHREWLKKSIKQYAGKLSHFSLLIAGIAGLPHFVDTMSLVIDTLKGTTIDVTLVDICEGPLDSIHSFIKKKTGFYTDKLYSKVHGFFKKSSNKIEYIHSDICIPIKGKDEKYDLAISHHLLTDMGFNEIKMQKYAERIHAMLKPDGILVAAQNIGVDEARIISFQRIMAAKGFFPVNAESVIDIYDFHQVENTEMKDFNAIQGIYVDKETLLTLHRKV